MAIKVKMSRQIISVMEKGIFWYCFFGFFVWKMQLSMLGRYMVTFIASLVAIKIWRHLKIKCTVMTINLQQIHALIKQILNQNFLPK